jgi:hypothetical protein
MGKIESDIVPSQSCDARVISGLHLDEFKVKRGPPLEEARYIVSEQIVRLHFEKVNEIRIGEIAPQLALNHDETGFGATKSSRTKSRNVMISREFGATAVFRERVDSYFVTGIDNKTRDRSSRWQRVLGHPQYSAAYKSQGLCHSPDLSGLSADGDLPICREIARDSG